MTVEIKGVDELVDVFDDIEALLKSPKPMQKIVTDVKELIQTKTEKGLDYMGRKFEPYSAAYAKKKGTSRANLKDTGTMLDAIKTEVLTPQHGRISVRPATYPGKKAKADMLAQIHTTGTGKQPQRDFFNITKSATEKIVKKHYDDPILKLAQKARRG